MISTVTTTYGRPALEALARVVAAAKADEPLAPVTVVVPSNHAGVTARRALASQAGAITSRGVGIIGVNFLTPHRLAELLGAARLAGGGRRPTSGPVIAAGLRRSLRADPGVFAPVAAHPATEESLVSAYAELADISAEALERLAGASPRAADVVRLCRTTRFALTADWYDEVDLLVAARRAVAEGDPVTGQLGHLVVYLPQELTRHTAALLREVANHSPTTVVVGLTGETRADAGVTRSLARLGIYDATADPPAGERWPVDPATTRIVTTSDADDEVRTVVRAVLDAARAGTPLERIAVLVPTEQPYVRLLHEHLAAAGIPLNGAAAHGLKGCLLGRTMLDLLALSDHGYRRHDVLGLLTSAPLRLRDGERTAPVGDWQRMTRKAAVVRGRAHWDQRLAHLADETDRRADDVDDTDDERREARITRYRRQAERTRALRTLVLGLIDDLEQAAAHPLPWRERVVWLRRLVARLLGGESARDRWPAVERRAAERVDAALDRLVALDGIDGPAELGVFRRTLELELDADLGRVGRFGEGVLVAPLSFAVGLDLDLVLVVGMAEGTLPSRPLDEALMPDDERRLTNGELPLRREYVDRQQRALRVALASAPGHVLCAPRGDLRSNKEQTPSRWLAEMADERIDLLEVPSFAYGVTHVTFPATEQEYRLRAPDPVTAADPIVAAGRTLRAARRSDAFTRFDGNLGGQPVRSPLDDVVSATRLEQWSVCPNAYFMRQVLRVEPVEDPADALWISPLDRGSLVHEVLERFLRAVLARPAEEQPGPSDAWTDADRALLADIASAACADYERRGVVGREVFWHRDRSRILTRLDRVLTDDDQRRQATRSRPIAAELAFGLPGGDIEAVDVPIAGGDEPRTLRFRGAADRIDLSEDGTLRVIDYKTGRPWEYRALSEENPDDRGTHLQLAVYGVAARAFQGTPDARVAAEYWFVGEGPGFSYIGYEVTDEVLARVGETLATIVHGIEHGVFPGRPTESSSDPFVRCWFCNPDGLGSRDRRREWEAKRHDPALSAYANLAEPEEAEAVAS
jgi:ATP-dependent helicase/nuclease subunit B